MLQTWLQNRKLFLLNKTIDKPIGWSFLFKIHEPLTNRLNQTVIVQILFIFVQLEFGNTGQLQIHEMKANLLKFLGSV